MTYANVVLQADSPATSSRAVRSAWDSQLMEESDKLQFWLNASVQTVQSWVCDCIAQAEAVQPSGQTLILARRACLQNAPVQAQAVAGAERFPVYAVTEKEGMARQELVLAVAFYPAQRSSNSSHARLEILYTPRFPLSPNALIRSVQARFPHARRTTSSAPEPMNQGRSRPGAPPLACNSWLEEQLAKLEDPEANYYQFYHGWRKEYYALRGYHPADPRRSFRKAVVGCLRRLRRKKK